MKKIITDTLKEGENFNLGSADARDRIADRIIEKLKSEEFGKEYEPRVPVNYPTEY